MIISGIKVMNGKEMAVLQGGKNGGRDLRFTRPDGDVDTASVTLVQAIRPACC